MIRVGGATRSLSAARPGLLLPTSARASSIIPSNAIRKAEHDQRQTILREAGACDTLFAREPHRHGESPLDRARDGGSRAARGGAGGGGEGQRRAAAFASRHRAGL